MQFSKMQNPQLLAWQVLSLLGVGLLGFGLGLTTQWNMKKPIGIFEDISQGGQNRQHYASHSEVIPQVPIAKTLQEFVFNDTFAAPPAEGEVESVWDSLLPNGLGYVVNPSLARNVSVISAFHQLHCLYTLRRIHFSFANSTLQDFDFGIDRSSHARHCFEYLRQSLMCSADSSLEPTEASQDGFFGWGVQRQCRDYGALRDWASKWRAFEGNGFIARPTQLKEKHNTGDNL